MFQQYHRLSLNIRGKSGNNYERGVDFNQELIKNKFAVEDINSSQSSSFATKVNKTCFEQVFEKVFFTSLNGNTY